MAPWIRLLPLRELVLARMREFLREPEVIFWVYVFPVILATGLGIAFREQPPLEVRVGLIGPQAERLRDAIGERSDLPASVLPADVARAMLHAGKLDVVIDGTPLAPVYILDPTRRDAMLGRMIVDEALQRAAGRADPVTPRLEAVTEPGTRYIDFLMPGILGMNLMGGGLYGVGFAIVDMRVRKLLKRFLATPMRAVDYFVAVFASRFIFMVPEMLFLLGVAALGFGMPIRGGFAALAVVIFAGAACFACIGLLVASRARRIETISGLINLVILPMWLLGGIFFNNARFPDIMQPVIQALPLTALNDALRAVILEGAGLTAIAGELGWLVGWTAAALIASRRLFRWL